MEALHEFRGSCVHLAYLFGIVSFHGFKKESSSDTCVCLRQEKKKLKSPAVNRRKELLSDFVPSCTGKFGTFVNQTLQCRLYLKPLLESDRNM